MNHEYMNGFLTSCAPFFQKYAVETILVATASIVTVISFFLLVQPQPKHDMALSRLSSPKKSVVDYIMVEVSGSVIKPGVYRLDKTARFVDALKAAQGLSPDADTLFFSRNFNLARFVIDQDKIYVPSVSETQTEMIEEPVRLVDYTAPQQSPSYANEATTQPSDQRISINAASIEELQTLSGIGPATAQKMVDARPYISLEDLVSKKIINVRLFEQAKKYIRL